MRIKKNGSADHTVTIPEAIWGCAERRSIQLWNTKNVSKYIIWLVSTDHLNHEYLKKKEDINLHTGKISAEHQTNCAGCALCEV
jgi:hypothetical protein